MTVGFMRFGWALSYNLLAVVVVVAYTSSLVDVIYLMPSLYRSDAHGITPDNKRTLHVNKRSV